mmetsp:Transcript_22823/g.26014  ORF Transcript_22823/g.26014 Transcript_22823/m.26014 type:complete len:750 (+) Transcript_22823:197-2446(+)
MYFSSLTVVCLIITTRDVAAWAPFNNNNNNCNINNNKKLCRGGGGIPSVTTRREGISRNDITTSNTKKAGKHKNPFLNHLSQTIRSTATTFALSLAIAGTIITPAVAATSNNNNNNNDAVVVSSSSGNSGYWTTMKNIDSSGIDRMRKNEKLIDFAVMTVNSHYYDNSGGVLFQPRDFHKEWIALQKVAEGEAGETTSNTALLSNKKKITTPKFDLESREGTVESLKWLVGRLPDQFSSYLTREELRQELQLKDDGFLGIGAMVEAPSSSGRDFRNTFYYDKTFKSSKRGGTMLTPTRAVNLPVITAIRPDSPAERAGLTAGDRIVAVGKHNFVGYSREDVATTLKLKYSSSNNKYTGQKDITIAKPVRRTLVSLSSDQKWTTDDPVNVVVGYKTSRVRLPTTSLEPFQPQHGNAYVHYELIQDSILDSNNKNSNNEQLDDSARTAVSAVTTNTNNNKVGYIRLTRFSRASTKGFLQAIDALDTAGVDSYIIDLRNNYGGVIQEALLTASSLLRDPHAVLCYTMNSRGGFTPHDVEEYIVDKRYPGYLLSKTESPLASLNQLRREKPDMFDDMTGTTRWNPPSSFMSLSEQRTKRGLSKPFIVSPANAAEITNKMPPFWHTQKKLVLLVNEGTASSAEVFASSLHDNGRTVALVGARTYGKGLIQHTFPMPDAGGLRLTVAEYLTPALHHVTNVGEARYDSQTGAWIRGGIQPDILCDAHEGIPSNIGADLCVGMALDALNEANNNNDI